ncbi:hypothetical protein QZH41_009405 [Actinostola sp. cb2023]|nr:hypothetical protein QZH41_009405 [Actinostola sp. cb2023]
MGVYICSHILHERLALNKNIVVKQIQLYSFQIHVGADINYQTSCQDGPLHIATFACASQSSQNNFNVLTTLIQAGCDINSRNWLGNTPLCIAASYDKERLIRFLIFQGADSSICNDDGIYPLDFATNAGYQHLTSLLTFKVSDPHVWDFIEPHTPPRIKLGLQTPCKKHLADSSFALSSKRKVNTFRTPRPVRSFSKDVYRKSRY